MKDASPKNGVVYLSGGIQYSADGGIGWRETTASFLNSIGYHAIDISALGKKYVSEHGNINDVYGSDAFSNELLRKAYIREHFVRTDVKLLIQFTDVVVMYYDESVRRGAGTISECMLAYEHNIPLYIISGFPNWKKEIPGWLYGISTKIFSSFDEFNSYFRALPDGVFNLNSFGNRTNGTSSVCSLSGQVYQNNGLTPLKVERWYSSTGERYMKQVAAEASRFDFILEQIHQDMTANSIVEEIKKRSIKTGSITVNSDVVSTTIAISPHASNAIILKDTADNIRIFDKDKISYIKSNQFLSVPEIIQDIPSKLIKSDLIYIQNLDPTLLYKLHHTIGQWIRNAYGLWYDNNPATPNRPIIEDGVDVSDTHPDAVSMEIIKQLRQNLIDAL